MNKYIHSLRAEIEVWVREGIITPAQADVIRSRYPVLDRGVSWGKIIFSVIGAVLLGLGVILLFAYNWEKMPRAAKLSVVFVSLVTAHGLGLWFRRDESNHKALGEGLNILGTMLFGAGIWLVAQIYHIDEHFPNAFLAWGMGALGLAWAFPSIAHGIMAAVILVFWNGCEVSAFHHPNHLGPPLILAGIIPLAVLNRSRVLMGIGLCAVVTALCFTTSVIENDLLFSVLFFSSCTLLGLGAADAGKRISASSLFSFLGSVPYMLILFILSFKGAGRSFLHLKLDTQSGLYFFILFFMAVTPWVMASRVFSESPEKISSIHRMNYLGVLAALIFFTFQTLFNMNLRGWAGAGFYNLIFLFHCILMILHGCRTANTRWAVTGCLLLSAIAIARYADLFNSLLMRSLVFFIIGGGIFAAGNFYSRAKKRIQGEE
jgi:uncharacterized membrane protein